MAKPYLNDLRQRVAVAIASGDSCRSIAEQYEIAPSTVVKWSKRLRETGSAARAKFGAHRTCSLEPHRDFLLEQLEAVPHPTLHKLKGMLAARGIVVSHGTPSSRSCRPTPQTSIRSRRSSPRVKHWLRLAQAHSIGAIHDNVAMLVSAITQPECANYFRTPDMFPAKSDRL